MCLANVCTKKEFKDWKKKQPDTIIMWRIFNKTEDGLESMYYDGVFPKSGTVSVQPIDMTWSVGTREDGLGFHCFLTRKEARTILKKLAPNNSYWGVQRVIRKVLVKKKDVKALGITKWGFYAMITKTLTAIVSEMNIQSPSEGR